MRSRGFSLIEFVVASSLTVAMFAASASALSAGLRVSASAEVADAAARLAYSTLETAKALGCNLGTGDETQALVASGDNLVPDPDSEGDTTDRARRCHDAFATLAATTGPDGSPVLLPCDQGSLPGRDDWSWASDPRPFEVLRPASRVEGGGDRSFCVTLRSAWLPARDASGDTVRPTAATSTWGQPPALLRRSATVSWTRGGEQCPATRSEPSAGQTSACSRTVSSLSSIPPDSAAYRDPLTVGLLSIDGTSPHSPVTIRSASGDELRRVSDELGVAWFPYLPAGSWTVTRDGTSVVRNLVPDPLQPAATVVL